MESRVRREATGYQKEPPVSTRFSTLLCLAALFCTLLNMHLSFLNYSSSSPETQALSGIDSLHKQKQLRKPLQSFKEKWQHNEPPVDESKRAPSHTTVPVEKKNTPGVPSASGVVSNRVTDNTPKREKKDLKPQQKLEIQQRKEKKVSVREKTQSKEEPTKKKRVRNEEEFSYAYNAEEDVSYADGNQEEKITVAKKDEGDKKVKNVVRKDTMTERDVSTLQRKEVESEILTPALEFLELKEEKPVLKQLRVQKPPLLPSQTSEEEKEDGDAVAYFSENILEGPKGVQKSEIVIEQAASHSTKENDSEEDAYFSEGDW